MSLSFIFTLVLLELLVVALIDFRTQKISNRWILVNISASIIFHIFANGLYPLSWEIMIFPIGFIIGGFFLYLMHVMGAGDSKFLASLFLIIPLEYHFHFFEKLIWSTLATGTILFLYRLVTHGSQLKSYFISKYWEGIKNVIKSRFSYAPVILLAWILVGVALWN